MDTPQQTHMPYVQRATSSKSKISAAFPLSLSTTHTHKHTWKSMLMMITMILITIAMGKVCSVSVKNKWPYFATRCARTDMLFNLSRLGSALFMQTPRCALRNPCSMLSWIYRNICIRYLHFRFFFVGFAWTRCTYIDIRHPICVQNCFSYSLCATQTNDATAVFTHDDKKRNTRNAWMLSTHYFWVLCKVCHTHLIIHSSIFLLLSPILFAFIMLDRFLSGIRLFFSSSPSLFLRFSRNVLLQEASYMCEHILWREHEVVVWIRYLNWCIKSVQIEYMN